MKKIGQRVRILGGMPEFVGKTGTVIDVDIVNGLNNPPLYRVELDEPVYFDDIGRVDNDLWESTLLQNIKG